MSAGTPAAPVPADQESEKSSVWIVGLVAGGVFLPVALAWLVPNWLSSRTWMWIQTRNRTRAAAVAGVTCPLIAVLLFTNWDTLTVGYDLWQQVALGLGICWLGVVPVAIATWHARLGRIGNQVADRTLDPRRLHSVETAIWKAGFASATISARKASPVVTDRDSHWRCVVGVEVITDRRSRTRKATTAHSSRTLSTLSDAVAPLTRRFKSPTECKRWHASNQLVLPEAATSAIILGATGSGKTTLNCGLIAANIRQGGSAVFFNGKGDQETADLLEQIAYAQGVEFRRWTYSGGAPFDGWRGSHHDVVSKIVSLLGDPSSDAARFYTGETRAALQRAADNRQQAGLEPWSSVTELLDDLKNANALGVSQSEAKRVAADVNRVFAGIEESVSGRNHSAGWCWEDAEYPSITLVEVTPHNQAAQVAATLMLFDLLGFKEARRHNTSAPLMVFVEEAQVLLNNDITPPVDLLIEQVRSANIGIIVAAQSVAGLGTGAMPERLLDSGVPIIAGNMPSGEQASNRAGTKVHAETGMQSHHGDPTGVTTSRIQDTYLVPPQALREFPPGCFVLIERAHPPTWFHALTAASFTSPAKAHNKQP